MDATSSSASSDGLSSAERTVIAAVRMHCLGPKDVDLIHLAVNSPFVELLEFQRAHPGLDLWAARPTSEIGDRYLTLISKCTTYLVKRSRAFVPTNGKKRLEAIRDISVSLREWTSTNPSGFTSDVDEFGPHGGLHSQPVPQPA